MIVPKGRRQGHVDDAEGFTKDDPMKSRLVLGQRRDTQKGERDSGNGNSVNIKQEDSDEKSAKGRQEEHPMAIALLLHWLIDGKQSIETFETADAEDPTVTMVLRTSLLVRSAE